MNKSGQTSAIKILVDTYRDKPHPLTFENLYQLLVKVILSAQSTDKLINEIAPSFFEQYPNIPSLATANEKTLYPLLNKVRNFSNKSNWLIKLAQTIKEDKNIPLTMEALTKLPGIGRKSANVILRGAGVEAEGIIVDLHVLRVAPRIGFSLSSDPKKMETELMAIASKNDWGELGMAISFLGREVCRPTNPEHHNCPINKHCDYFKSLAKKQSPKKRPVKNRS